jgi:predicted ferric reductase
MALLPDLLEIVEQRHTDETIFRQVWNDCWKSLFLYGAVLAGIVVLDSFSRPLGLLLFAIFAVVSLRDTLRLLYAIGLGVLVLPLTLMIAFKVVSLRDWRGGTDEVYLLNANAVILMQLFILVGYNLFLYNHFFITNSAA